MTLAALALTWLGAWLWVAAIVIVVLGAGTTLKLLSSTPPHMDAAFALYPVSILKPLKGVDAGLKKNLESLFNLDYPDFELLFCVAASSDPALPLVRELVRRHPYVRSRVFVGETPLGLNPKVNNMVRAYEEARYDWVLISDSNVRVQPDCLKRLVAHLDPGVGILTAVVAATEESGLGAHLESMVLGTFYARNMCLTARLGHPCVVGKTMMFRRSTAARFGGLRILARYLAEDYMAGEAMKRLGLEARIVSDPTVQVLGSYRFKDFWARHLRWGRIRKAQAPLAFIVEPFMGCMGSALIGALAIPALIGISSGFFLVLHFSFWCACDLLVFRKVRGGLHPLSAIHWMMRESLAPLHWAHIASGNTVDWRGTKLTLQLGGTLVGGTLVGGTLVGGTLAEAES